MKRLPIDQEKTQKLRQSDVGVAFYKQFWTLWNAVHMEYQPGVTSTQLNQAYEKHDQALREFLELLIENEHL